MAKITGLTAERMREIEAASIIDGTIDSSGHLILTRYDGQQIDAGSAVVAVPASSTVKYLSGFNNSTPSSSYPDGISLLWIDGSTNATAWPTFSGKWGSILTVNYTATQSDNDTTQIWTRLHGVATTPEQWIRSGNTTGWSAWIRLATTDDIANTKSYADGLVSPLASKSYVDGQISPLPKKNYVDTAVSGAVASANSYADGLKYPMYAIQFGNGTVPTATLTVLGAAATPLSPANGYVRGVSRITLPSAGSYFVSYRYIMNGGVGTPRAFVELTLGALSQYMYSIPADTVTFARNSVGESENIGVVSASVSVAAGAQIGANAYQSSGVSRSVDGVLHIQRIT